MRKLISAPNRARLPGKQKESKKTHIQLTINLPLWPYTIIRTIRRSRIYGSDIYSLAEDTWEESLQGKNKKIKNEDDKSGGLCFEVNQYPACFGMWFVSKSATKFSRTTVRFFRKFKPVVQTNPWISYALPVSYAFSSFLYKTTLH